MNKDRLLIGLSLSFCIRDIASGKVDLDDVQEIVSSTMAFTLTQIMICLDRYQESYWLGYPDAIEIALGFVRSGKVYQPRCDYGSYMSHNIAAGHWVYGNERNPDNE